MQMTRKMSQCARKRTAEYKKQRALNKRHITAQGLLVKKTNHRYKGAEGAGAPRNPAALFRNDDPATYQKKHLVAYLRLSGSRVRATDSWQTLFASVQEDFEAKDEAQLLALAETLGQKRKRSAPDSRCLSQSQCSLQSASQLQVDEDGGHSSSDAATGTGSDVET